MGITRFPPPLKLEYCEKKTENKRKPKQNINKAKQKNKTNIQKAKTKYKNQNDA
jgi:hypothetical protein